MTSIRLTDNRFDRNAQKLTPNECELKLLQKWSGRCTLSELRKHHVTTFSYGDAKESSDPFFKLTKGDNDNEYRLETGNLMGVLRLSDKDTGETLQIEIGSRFDSGDKQFFLNYLLSKVFDVHFADLVATNSDSMWDILLAIVFCVYLENAREVGLFKQYKQFEYNDLNFRGKLDLDRHLKRNFPLFDKIAYSRREITFDNPLNHLILHAAEKIKKKWGRLIESRPEESKFLDELKQHLPSWSAHGVGSIFNQKEVHHEIRHPYFAEYYERLREISLGILHDEGASQYQDENDREITGVIFDGTWLWEKYLWTILEPAGFTHADNSAKPKTNPIYAFREYDEKNKKYILKKDLYPDFYIEKKIVLDAKYKVAGNRRDDLHQVFSYMYLLGAKFGGLIFPPDPEAKKELEKKTINQKTLTNENDKRLWCCFRFNLLDKKDVSEGEFSEHLEAEEKRLRDYCNSFTD